jgi:glutathione S-transferase
MTEPNGNLPVLWQLRISHFNEKARWALDYKGVPHLRRTVEPGRHRAVARKLTGGTTFPVLSLDGKAIGDSTGIIEALEQLQPTPALYPPDARERRRALELEEFFDEELGPYARLLALHHSLADRDLFLGMFVPDMGRGRRIVARRIFPLVRRRVIADFGIDERSVDHAYGKLRDAGERFQTERQPSGYLCGTNFSVADLTLAALVSPLVAPEEFPYPQPQRGHPLLAPLRDALDEVGIGDFAREMYARHRGRSAEIVANGR